MIRAGCLVAALAIAGCARPADPVAAPVPLRNPTAPVASQADVTAARLQGDWIVVQGAGIAPGTVVRGTADGLTVQGVEYILTAPGRLSNADGRLWVHWLDIGDRTAAVGDPDGGRVWIMDREAGSSPDRLRAAREILDWYGYDLRRLAGLGRGMGS